MIQYMPKWSSGMKMTTPKAKITLNGYENYTSMTHYVSQYINYMDNYFGVMDVVNSS